MVRPTVKCNRIPHYPSPIQCLSTRVSNRIYIQNIYAGISVLRSDKSARRVAIAIRNSTYLVDCFVCEMPVETSDTSAHTVCERIVSALHSYSDKYKEKIAGAALPLSLANKYPALCPRLWQQLDIVPLVLGHKGRAREDVDQGELSTFLGWDKKELDEQADSMVRKCIRYAQVLA
jgi:hypothetical protein